MQIDMRFRLILLIASAAVSVCAGNVKRSSDHLFGSTNFGGTVTFGERGVSECLAAGNSYWQCYTEQTGFNPQWR